MRVHANTNETMGTFLLLACVQHGRGGRATKYGAAGLRGHSESEVTVVVSESIPGYISPDLEQPLGRLQKTFNTPTSTMAAVKKAGAPDATLSSTRDYKDPRNIANGSGSSPHH